MLEQFVLFSLPGSDMLEWTYDSRVNSVIVS